MIFKVFNSFNRLLIRTLSQIREEIIIGIKDFIDLVNYEGFFMFDKFKNLLFGDIR